MITHVMNIYTNSHSDPCTKDGDVSREIRINARTTRKHIAFRLLLLAEAQGLL